MQNLERSPRPVLILMVGLAVAACVLASAGWRMAGGSLFTISTASMCPDMCVGTLVLDRPVTGPIRTGEVVTFRPPGTNTVYTHRVVKVLADGSFKTAGDTLRSVDPWTVPANRVIGRVVAHVRDLGWLWISLPGLAIALACYTVARRGVARWLRPHTDVLFVILLISVPDLVLRPLLRMAIVGIGRRHGSIVLQLVNTGVLPASFDLSGGLGGSHVAPGHLLTVVVPPTMNAVVLHEGMALSPWQWAIGGLILLLPVLALLARLLQAHHSAQRPPRAPALPRPVLSGAVSEGATASIELQPARYGERR